MQETQKEQGRLLDFQVGLDSSKSSAIQIRFPDSAGATGILDVRGDLAGNVFMNASDAIYLRDTVTSIDAFYSEIGGSLFRQEITASDGSEHLFFYMFILSRGNVADVRDNLYVWGMKADSEGNTVDRFAPVMAIDGDLSSGNYSQKVSISSTMDVSGLGFTLELDLRGYSVNKIESPDVTITTNALEASGVESRLRALNALEIVSNRRAVLGQTLGNIGAGQSRIFSAINNLSVAKENSLAAESRIRDIDVAEESSNQIRDQILQRTASAILSQANQQPNLALRLLRGNGDS